MADVRQAANELKSNWEAIQKEFVGKGRKAVSSVRGATKKAVKTATKATKARSAPKARKK